MNKKIAILPGDGVGPDVIEQAQKVLDAIAERFGHQFDYHHADIGATAINKSGDPLPEYTLETCLNADAVLLGAVGHPSFDNNPKAKMRPEQGLLRLRKELGIYANIRPVKTSPNLLHYSALKAENVKGVDFVIYRELTGGIYFGGSSRSEDGQTATDICRYSTAEVERIARKAFEHAAQRRGKLTLVDKANVLETSRLWREVIQDLAMEYSHVAVNMLYIDNAATRILLTPQQFDIILTPNLFGDVLSHVASLITGSIGMLPSASLGDKTPLFEPIHGSFPYATDRGIANPIAAVLSAALLLEHFKLRKEAKAIRTAVTGLLRQGIATIELDPQMICDTSQIGDILAAYIADEDYQLRQDVVRAGASTII